MLDRLELATFAELTGEKFELRMPEGEAVELELLEARRAGELSAKQARELGKREPFSLVFRGPGEVVLPQAIWRVRHAGLGEIDLFLVPIEQRDEGTLYEAVFT